RSVGRRLDDARAALSLPSIRNLRARLRAGVAAGSRALVFALALRPLARDHPSRRACASKVSASRRVICDEPAALRSSLTSYNRDFVLPPCARGGSDRTAPSSTKSAHRYLHS